MLGGLYCPFIANLFTEQHNPACFAVTSMNRSLVAAGKPQAAVLSYCGSSYVLPQHIQFKPHCKHSDNLIWPLRYC